MVVWFTTTCAISAYHHKCRENEPNSWLGVLHTTLCDKVCQWLATGWWFSPGISVSSTNKTDCHNEILLKVVLNTINQTKFRNFDTLYRSMKKISTRFIFIVISADRQTNRNKHNNYIKEKNTTKLINILVKFNKTTY